MKKPVLSKLPSFKSDREIAAFMEANSGFDLLDAGLATMVPTPSFIRKQKVGKMVKDESNAGKKNRAHKKSNRSKAGITTE